MMLRASLVLVLVAGSSSPAQDVMQVTYTWTEVLAGTTTPVLTPNGVLEPGEGALIHVGIMALHNGSNAIGQVTTYSGPVGPGFGIIRGIGSFVYSLVGAGADASGSWNSRATTSVLPSGAHPGYIAAAGARVNSFGGGQVMPPGSSANATNPIPSAWRGVWNPVSFESRTVTFKAEASDAVPAGQQNSIQVQFGSAFLIPGDPSTEYGLFWGTYIPSDFGAGVDIPIGGGTGGLLCYPNCDGSNQGPVLAANDFACFLNYFAAGNTLANCDGSMRSPQLSANDLVCFLNRYAGGCP